MKMKRWNVLILMLLLSVVAGLLPYCVGKAAGIDSETEEKSVKWADDKGYSYGNLRYVLSEDGEKVCIIGFTGTSEERNLVIPDMIDGKKVTSFGNNEHYIDAGIGTCFDQVTISKNIKNIFLSDEFIRFRRIINVVDDNQYYVIVDGILYNKAKTEIIYCFSINESIEVLNSVTSIGESAFAWRRGLKNIVLPEGVTSIGESAFAECQELTNIVLPEGVTSIGKKAFVGCYGLTSIELPKKLKSIDESAFSGCNNLTSISLPEGVTSIGKAAFYDCSKLTSIELPEGITGIGDFAFQGCRGLVGIDIPAGVTNIGKGVFQGCKNLSDINVEEGNQYYTSWEGVLYDKDKTTLVSYPLSVENVEIPEGVKCIEAYAFAGGGFKEIVIPEGVTSIGNNAFDGCYSLRLTIPESVTEIGDDICGDYGESASRPTFYVYPDSYAAERVKEFGGEVVYLKRSVTDIKLNKNSLLLAVDEDKTIVATITPSNATNKELVWASSDDMVVTVADTTGNITIITGLSQGKAVITATAKDGSDISASCEVTVTTPGSIKLVEKIELSDKSITMKAEEVKVLDATVSPSDATVKGLTWTSSDETVATVDLAGKVTGKKDGKATITATANDGSDISASCEVTVGSPDSKKLVEKIELSDKSITIKPDEVKVIEATVSPSDATIKALTWTSSDETVATVDVTGKVTGKKDGKATITATATDGSSISANCEVTVVSPESIKLVEKIELSDKSITIKTDEVKVIEATVSPSDATIKELTWTSSDETVATVDATGKVTGKKDGKATITATATDGSNISASCEVTVEAKEETNPNDEEDKPTVPSPKKTSISKLTAKSKGFKVTWKKKNVTGYEICYAAKSNFSGKKTVKIKSAKTTSKTISKLKSKTKYYVKIRTYKTVKGKKYYSKWSSVKTIKTKK